MHHKKFFPVVEKPALNPRSGSGTATNPISDTLKYVKSDKHNATNVITDKLHNTTNIITSVIMQQTSEEINVIRQQTS